MGDATTVPAGEFKAKCLQMIDQTAEARTEYVITKYGKPLAKLVPLTPDADLMGSVTVLDDEDDLLGTDVSWDAASAAEPTGG